MLSGYRLMWVTVMFDLPVVERSERKAATDFRNTLLDMGFEMAQFSVYMRFCTSQAQIDTFCKRVEQALPEGGKVNILIFTDKQYERIISYCGKAKQAAKKSPDQFNLF
ncbi:MAG: CRISPR-associated endonuclease Cas2 [Gammaproteobacteria bacterium]|nr:CRISPR-associated endonuclease Cas2 [Gammaproteobacteria bacterium]